MIFAWIMIAGQRKIVFFKKSRQHKWKARLELSSIAKRITPKYV